MLYYVINDINCDCLINGFSVAGSNININENLILGVLDARDCRTDQQIKCNEYITSDGARATYDISSLELNVNSPKTYNYVAGTGWTGKMQLGTDSYRINKGEALEILNCLWNEFSISSLGIIVDKTDREAEIKVSLARYSEKIKVKFYGKNINYPIDDKILAKGSTASIRYFKNDLVKLDILKLK